MNIVFFGSSITSSWNNVHVTTYRGLVRALHNRGHKVLFLERDLPGTDTYRDLPNPDYCQVELYTSVTDLKQRFTGQVQGAELVIVGSAVPEGVAVGEWVCQTAKGIKAFYDLDNPATLARLERKDYSYLQPDLIPRFDLYLSCSGGPNLELMEKQYGAPMARPLYHSIEPELYYHEYREIKWDLGYLATYSGDRQAALNSLMLEAAKQWPEGRFAVAGAHYPQTIVWPSNVKHLHHLLPTEHRAFYNSQRFMLNIPRAEAVKAGYTPNIRLFEAAACGTPIISTYWEGLESLFDIDTEILVAHSDADTLRYLREICNTERKTIGHRAKRKVLAQHTAAHRVLELEGYVAELMTLGPLSEEEISVGS